MRKLCRAYVLRRTRPSLRGPRYEGGETEMNQNKVALCAPLMIIFYRATMRLQVPAIVTLALLVKARPHNDNYNVAPYSNNASYWSQLHQASLPTPYLRVAVIISGKLRVASEGHLETLLNVTNGALYEWFLPINTRLLSFYFHFHRKRRVCRDVSPFL